MPSAAAEGLRPRFQVRSAAEAKLRDSQSTQMRESPKEEGSTALGGRDDGEWDRKTLVIPAEGSRSEGAQQQQDLSTAGRPAWS